MLENFNNFVDKIKIDEILNIIKTESVEDNFYMVVDNDDLKK